MKDRGLGNNFDSSVYIQTDAVFVVPQVVAGLTKGFEKEFVDLLKPANRFTSNREPSKYVSKLMGSRAFGDWERVGGLINRNLLTLTENLDRTLNRVAGVDVFENYHSDGYRDFRGVRRDWPFFDIPIGLTLQEQISWWRGLTPAEQDRLIENFGSALLDMRGLSEFHQHIRETAHLGEIPLSSSEFGAGFMLTIPLKYLDFRAGADMSSTTTVMANGSVEVKLSLSAEVGLRLTADAGFLKAYVGAGVTGANEVVYRFRNQAEAEAFLSGLVGCLEPNGLMESAEWIVIPAYGANEIASRLEGFLSTQRRPADVIVSGGAYLEGGYEADFIFGETSGEVRGDLSISHSEVTGDTDVAASIRVGGSGSLLGVGREVELSATATAHFGADRPISVLPDSVSMDIEAKAFGTVSQDVLKAFGFDPAGLKFKAEMGYEVSLHVEIPVSVEGADVAMDSLLASLKHGVPLGAASVKALVDAGYVEVKVTELGRLEAGFENDAVELGGRTETSRSIAVFRKPVGGRITMVDLDGGM